MKRVGATTWLWRVTVSLITVCLVLVLAGGAPVHAGPRPLHSEERDRVEDAVEFLREMGDDQWADRVQIWLEEGLMLADPAIAPRAQTDERGRIIIRTDTLAAPTEAQRRDPVALWGLNVDLAAALVHRMVPAYHRIPDAPEPESRTPSDWGDSLVAFLACEGPHATEVEAHYTAIDRLLVWLQRAEAQVDPADPDAETRPRSKTEWLRAMIADRVRQLRDADPPAGADRHHYEKADYLADAFARLDESEMSAPEMNLARIELLRARLGAMFAEDGPYERMRAGAQRARRQTAAATATPQEGAQLQIGEGLRVTVPPDAVGAAGEVSVSLVDLDRGPPAGYAWVYPRGADTAAFQIRAEERVAGVRLTLKPTDLPAGSEPLLYALSEVTPPQWMRVPGEFAADDDGQYSFEAEVEPGLYAFLVPAGSFTDVPPGHPAYEAAEQLRRREVMLGTGDGTFGATGQLTRAQFAALLARVLELDSMGLSHPFTDVSADAWYGREGVIDAVFAHDLLRGVSATEFAPEAPVTREQVYTVLLRALEEEELALALEEAELGELLRGFTGVSPWARPYVAGAGRSGLIVTVDASFDAAMLRDEAARLLHRLVTAERAAVTALPVADVAPPEDEDEGIPEREAAVDPADPTTLSGLYDMTGEAAVFLPGTAEPQILPVRGGFDLAVDADDPGYTAHKKRLGGRLIGLVLPMEVAAEAGLDAPPEPVTVWLDLVDGAVQTGQYDPDSGTFWMISTVSAELGDLGALAGPHPGTAVERGSIDSVTADYSSEVALSIVSGPLTGTTVLFSKGGNRGDSLDDIRRLLEKDSLTDEERERVRRYLRDSAASEADKIEILRDLIELAQDATGRTLLITPVGVIDAIIDGIRDIEESMYRSYRDMRNAGLIDGPGGFPYGTSRQREKYEMRYLLEDLRRQLR